MKRFLDLVIASAGLILLTPVWAAAVFLILTGDFGPVFYVQPRVGRNGKLFNLYKFRTMYQNPPETNPGFVTLRNDPRVFRGGQFLRKFKLDELPQLLNVIEGSMSLVGPRPTVSEDYEKMDNEQRRRFLVRPGITGLAQISGNTSLPWQKRIKYDLAYIENQSLRMDIRILFQTVLLVITGRAETHPPGEDEWEDR